MNKSIIFGSGAVTLVAIAAFWWMTGDQPQNTPIVSTSMHGADAAAPATEADSLTIPTFSQMAQSGEIAFTENCAACHGVNAAGTEQGPPLVHQLYVPGHHSDDAIMLAAKNGVRSHHWRFGNMPPVEGITDTKIKWITTYIRELQQANGIQ